MKISDFCKNCEHKNRSKYFLRMYENGEIFQTLCALRRTLKTEDLTELEQTRLRYFTEIKNANNIDLKKRLNTDEESFLKEVDKFGIPTEIDNRCPYKLEMLVKILN